MRTEMLPLGSVPLGETFSLVGERHYDEKSLVECQVLRRMLLRLHPLPKKGAAALTIENCCPHTLAERQVCVRFRGRAGTSYALHLERHRPRNWDAVASRDIHWFVRRRMLELLVLRGLTARDAVPAEFLLDEPPVAGEPIPPPVPAVSEVLQGPTSREWHPTGAILGALDTAEVPAVAVRVKASADRGSEVVVYAADFTRRLGRLSMRPEEGLGLLGDREFYVTPRFENNAWLSDALFSDLFEVTGRLGPEHSQGERYPIWRIRDRVMRSAVPLCVLDEPSH